MLQTSTTNIYIYAFPANERQLSQDVCRTPFATEGLIYKVGTYIRTFFPNQSMSLQQILCQDTIRYDTETLDRARFAREEA